MRRYLRLTVLLFEFDLLKIALAAAFVCALAIAQIAQATLTITSVGTSSASNVTGIGGSSNITIYGGVAGHSNLGGCASVDDITTCNNCVAGDGTDAGLQACNSQRIYDNLALQITLQSDDLDGAYLTAGPAAGTSGTTINIASGAGNSNPLTKGTARLITIRWQDICSVLTNPSTGAQSAQGSTCEIGGGATTVAAPTAQISGDIKFVLSKSGSFTDTTGETATVHFVVQYQIGQVTGSQSESSVINDCASVTDSSQLALCNFVVGSGDTKAVVDAIKLSSVASAFPTGNNINYTAFRFLYYDAGSGTQAADPTQFTHVDPASNHSDLAVTGSQSSGDTAASPSWVEGLTNDHVYYFRTAVIDQAMNVGFYTSTAAATVCDTDMYPGLTNDGKGTCHISYPGQVVGILSKSLNCFVATAAYGSPMAPEVATFRAFRNTILLHSDLGLKFVRWYYRNSPTYAAIIAKNETLRTVSRAALWPMLMFVRLSLRFDFLQALAMSLATFALVTVLIVTLARALGSLKLRRRERGGA
jgi:hypothetical protein